MADIPDKRPWWQRKTEQGVLLAIISLPLHLFPLTAPMAASMFQLGCLWAGYGAVDRASKK